MINHTVLWRLSAPVSFSLLLFCTSCLHAQDETSLQNIKFYPSSLNSEFSNATRVQLGRVNFPEHNSFMLNPAGVNLTNPDTRNFDDEGLIRYQKQINQIEDLQGMFAEALYQPLLSVARLYQQRDDHISALQNLDRAKQINKTINGLYSPDQILLTRLELDSQKALGDVQEISNLLNRLTLIHHKVYGAGHNETAFALLELGNWQLNSFLTDKTLHADDRLANRVNSATRSQALEAYTPALQNLYEAQSTFINAISTVVANQYFSDTRLFTLEDKLISTYYLNAKREDILFNPDSVWATETRNFSSIKRLKTLEPLPADFFNGESAYKRQLAYLQKNNQATLGQLSGIMLALADWYQLFDQFDKAQQQHEKLANMLRKANLSDSQIADLLSKDDAVPLPTFIQTPLSPRAFTPESTQGHIDLAIHINRWGKVSDVEIMGISEATPEKVIDHLVSTVKASRYRTDSINGNTSGIRYYYQY